MIEIFILSLVQGITEFLPISSSSHLILISDFLDFKNQNLSIDVSLHIGSFIAVLLYFYKDILNFFDNKILFFKIFISSIPLMIIGFFLAETGFVEKIRNLKVIAWTTVIFGFLLFLSDKFKLEKNIEKNFTMKSAIFIGLFQVLSLIPGVSRSGIAITASRLLNFKRVDAAKISFLLSIPILGAVSLFGLKNLIFSENSYFTVSNLIAIFFSFLTSLITIKYFLIYIKKFNLNIFVYYRILLGLILLAIAYL
ncbi:undecaprenyl-diphosphate phosphatase [Candidatus Pelagibacter bacterium]|nr:undecaprenyl-diphosphate phosphatase [Candidatus Pelagibacter bacterium]